MNLPWPVVLASASPRRRELLEQVTQGFEVLAPDVDEESLTSNDPWKTAETLAKAKAAAVFRQRPTSLVIGGDTVVSVDIGAVWMLLAKPQSPEDACRILRLLSGRAHIVVTGVSLISPDIDVTFSDDTRVVFRKLSEAEIAAYVATGEPMDKAGAYAIQGGAAGFVDSVQGSISNVIGLPLERLRAHLDEFKLP